MFIKLWVKGADLFDRVRSEDGQGALEYALLVAAIAAIIAVAATGLGDKIKSAIEAVNI
jgi:Flp pilus assembly pilin Flp